MTKIDAYDTIEILALAVRQIAKEKNYADSYAYQYGFFQSAITDALADTMSPAQIKKLYKAIHTRYKAELDAVAEAPELN